MKFVEAYDLDVLRNPEPVRPAYVNNFGRDDVAAGKDPVDSLVFREGSLSRYSS
jgi:hypothetical protein